MLISLLVSFLMILTSILCIPVLGHSPQDMQLTYEYESQILQVTITHNVVDPSDHYIYKIDIEKNNEIYDTFTYTSQPSTTSFTYEYSIDTIEDDQLDVSAFCSIAGSITKTITVVNDTDNNPPEKPSIIGPTNGETGTSYDYILSSNDPENDMIYYCIEWDENSDEVCIGPYNSGEEVTVSHSWNQEGTYTIRVKARDEYGQESDYQTLEVTMPKNKEVISIFHLLLKFFFPGFFKLI